MSAGRRSEGGRRNDSPASDLLALHALFIPLSFPFGRLLRRLGICRSCRRAKATTSDAMISRAMKSHTNEHTVRGRPTLKVVKCFRKGSVCKAYERSIIYEQTF